MKVSVLTSVLLELDQQHESLPPIKVQLDAQAAFCLALFISKANWPTEGKIIHFLKLEKPTVFEMDNEFPDQLANSCYVTAYPGTNTEKVFFDFGPGDNQQLVANREELLLMLNTYFATYYGEELYIPSVPAATPEDTVVENGFMLNGRKVGIKNSKYVVLVSAGESGNNPLPICDTEIFYGNKNLKRPTECTDIALVTKVFTGGFHGQETKDNIVFYLGNGGAHDVLALC